VACRRACLHAHGRAHACCRHRLTMQRPCAPVPCEDNQSTLRQITPSPPNQLAPLPRSLPDCLRAFFRQEVISYKGRADKIYACVTGNVYPCAWWECRR
jgi:hypothetical protein